jgi:hypothetical protein
MQWHPLFAELLRPLVQPHYEVRTNVPVGDVPREADIVLLRRINTRPPPFRGLWSHLTPWNVLELKGPNTSPRHKHLAGLVEVGLGIHRHVQGQQGRGRRARIPETDVSFWYLVNHLGQRLLNRWKGLVGKFAPLGAGLWRCEILGHSVFLVSGKDLPLEEDSVPLHLIGQEAPEAGQALAEFVVARPGLWHLYQDWLGVFHEPAYRRVVSMARTKTEKIQISFEPLIERIGMPELIRRLGLKRVVDAAGLKRVIDEVGLKRVVKEVSMEQLAAALTQEQFRELQRLKS